MRNVFVLNTGRCGSVTFARACEHLTNYTVGHETRAAVLGAERLAYPADHIEVDNRLSWFLGSLGRRFDDSVTFYVHLIRDPNLVAASFARRWASPFRASMIRAFGHGIVMEAGELDDDAVRTVCDDYVRTVNDNIRAYLEHRPSITIDIDEAAEAFGEFAARIDAIGDVDAAVRELGRIHNAG